jgi:hypothetical protein
MSSIGISDCRFRIEDFDPAGTIPTLTILVILNGVEGPLHSSHTFHVGLWFAGTEVRQESYIGDFRLQISTQPIPAAANYPRGRRKHRRFSGTAKINRWLKCRHFAVSIRKGREQLDASVMHLYDMMRNFYELEIEIPSQLKAEQQGITDRRSERKETQGCRTNLFEEFSRVRRPLTVC